MAISGAFIQGGAGRILVVRHEPEVPRGRVVLVVPAFAEEMNRSRRLVFETARALCGLGICTVVPDLYGTGDSDGEFSEARWETWIEDLCATVAWARQGTTSSLSALCVRFGAALFSAAEETMDAQVDRVVAWEPIAKGGDLLRHLIRVKLMAQRMSGGAVQSFDELRQRLFDSAESLELGGYAVASDLAAAIDSAVFSIEATTCVRNGLVIDIGPSIVSQPEPVVAGGVWRKIHLSGERFWSVIEPQSNPTLVQETVRFLAQ